MVRREIGRSEFASVLPAGMVISGGGAMLKGMRELARDITGMPVRVGYPGGVGGLAESVNAPTFATAVGLVRWGGRLQAGIVRRETEGGLLAALLKWLRRIRMGMGVK
jgi:cell division protein FtsA